MRLTGGGGPLYNFVSSPITEPRGEGYGEDLSEKKFEFKNYPFQFPLSGRGVGERPLLILNPPVPFPDNFSG